MPGRKLVLLPLVALVALGPLTACSDDGPSASAPPSPTFASVRKRPCSVVTEAEVREAVGHEVKASTKDGLPCRYTATNPDESSVVVEVRNRATADAATRLLPNGKPIEGLGSDARFDPQGGPLGARLVVRRGGTLVLVDLGPVPSTDTSSKGQTVAIARDALRRAPRSKVASSKPAGKTTPDDPCARLAANDGKALAKVVGVAVTVTPSYPSGCAVTVPGLGMATVQIERLAGPASKIVDGLGRATDGKAWPKVAIADLGESAAWLSDPTAPGAGQLAVAADGQLLTVSTDRTPGTANAGQLLATAVARTALG